MMGITQAVAAFLVDCFIPRVEGDDRLHDQEARARAGKRLAEVDSSIENLPEADDVLRDALDGCEGLWKQERERKSSVETRLSAIVGLASLAGSVVLTALFSLASGSTQFASTWIGAVLAVGCLYLALQLCVALHYAIRGLQRAGYETMLPTDILPDRRTSSGHYLRDRIRSVAAGLEQNRRINDGKVTHLALAQRALQNFLGGLLLIAVITTVTAIHAPRSTDPVQSNRATLCQRQCEDASDSRRFDWRPRTSGDPIAAQFDEPPSERLNFSLAAMGLGLILWMIGGACIGFWRFPGHNIIGAGILTLGTVSATAGGLHFKLTGAKIDNLIGSIEFNLSHQSNTKVDTVAAAPLSLHLIHVATIGPFGTGEHQLDSRPLVACLKGRLATRPSTIVGWQIVGRADKRDLTAKVGRVCGSNQMLAMARATWVRDNVLAPLIPSSYGVLVSVAGAENVGAVIPTDSLASDRVVEIFAFVGGYDAQSDAVSDGHSESGAYCGADWFIAHKPR